MPQVTYFAVLPFSRTEDGNFLAEAAIEVRSAAQAKATASRMEGEGKGAVAFSETGERTAAIFRFLLPEIFLC